MKQVGDKAPAASHQQDAGGLEEKTCTHLPQTLHQVWISRQRKKKRASKRPGNRKKKFSGTHVSSLAWLVCRCLGKSKAFLSQVERPLLGRQQATERTSSVADT